MKVVAPVGFNNPIFLNITDSCLKSLPKKEKHEGRVIVLKHELKVIVLKHEGRVIESLKPTLYPQLNI